MHWPEVKNDWKQYRGKVKDQWSKLTDVDLDEIAGNRAALVTRLKDRYGIEHDKAGKQADEFVKSLNKQDVKS